MQNSGLSVTALSDHTMDINNDTIAAISTAPGEAGISIIRISGPASQCIADRVFKCSGDPPSKRPSYTMIHGSIESVGNMIDEVILLIMRAPHSYTREDVVEIQGHGGIMSARRILRCVCEAGVRPAEPGEFTKRAFLNGRIDLLQAEAVLDVIRARSDRSAQAAIEQLEGSLSALFNDTYNSLVSINADLEATLDFSDEEVPPLVLPDVLTRLRDVKHRIVGILETWEEGHILREGALVVISGKPNVGKSTLLNGLLGKDRVIVSSQPGTTRDTIEEGFILDGIPLRLVDTAGLRKTECEIEKQGVTRAREHLQKADIFIYIIDSSESLDSEDIANLRDLDLGRSLVILNKTDLGQVVYHVDLHGVATIHACLIQGKGLDKIRDMIIEKVSVITSNPPHAVISERHRQLLIMAQKDLDEAVNMVESMKENLIVLAASRIRSALEFLGQVTGKTYHEQLLNSIFSRFCIGK